MADDEEYCRKYPYSGLCKSQEKTFQLRTFKTDKDFHKSFIADEPDTPPRRFGVREGDTETPTRPAVTRRFGVREELDGIHDELQHRHHPRYYDVSRPDFRTQKIAKKTSRSIQRQKDKFLKELELGTQEVEHTAEEVLNAYLSQGAYENAFKSSSAAERYVRSGSHLVPELQMQKLLEIQSIPTITTHFTKLEIVT